MVWHRLAQHLTNKGLRLAFTGGGGEVEGKRIANVARFLPKGSYRKFSGALSFGQTAELLRRAALYVGVDTSTTHVAAAVGVLVLALFGPTSACHWGPAPSAGSRNFANHVSLQRSKTVTSRRIPTTPTVVNAVPDTRRVVRARATRVSRCASRRCRRTSWSRKSTAFWQAVPTRRSPSAPGLRIFPRNRTEKTVARRPGTVCTVRCRRSDWRAVRQESPPFRSLRPGKQAFERFPRQQLKPRKAGEGRHKEHRVVLL